MTDDSQTQARYARSRGLRHRVGNRAFAKAMTMSILLLVAPGRGAVAASLEDDIPALFAGHTTSLNRFGRGLATPLPPDLTTLSSALAAFRSQVPLPSANGAFRFVWDPAVQTYSITEESLGPSLAERAPTLGWRTLALNVSYTHLKLDSLNGHSLDSLQTTSRAIPADELHQLPPDDQVSFGDDLVQTQLAFALTLNQVFLTAAFGITNSIDASLSLSLNEIQMSASGTKRILNPAGNDSVTFNAPYTQSAECGGDVRHCVADGFDDSAAGTGDLFLRLKWNFANTAPADFAAVGVLTLPTGNADDFLGFHDPTFTPWLVASKQIGWIEPRINLGVSIRSSEDVSQARWTVGADVRATPWLTLSGDFLGYDDIARDGVSDDIIQSAVGFKVNLIAGLVLVGDFQFPVNSQGLRADVIYTGQVEYTF